MFFRAIAGGFKLAARRPGLLMLLWAWHTCLALVAVLPFWMWVPCALLMMLVPVLFGYAVVKHRVLEFSVLVRRSARYVFVQRGFVLLAVAVSIAVTAVFVAGALLARPGLPQACLLPLWIALKPEPRETAGPAAIGG